jgi:hypothetical protein
MVGDRTVLCLEDRLAVVTVERSVLEQRKVGLGYIF